MRTKEEILKEITELKERIENIENGDEYKAYDEMLNDCYPITKIGCCEFEASRILKELDEIAYNVGYNDYTDSCISDLETELEDLETELKEVV